jgi:predicted transcriptional regulator
LPASGSTSYTDAVKTAISLPDDVFREMEACAKRLKMSRSGLVVAATREFLARHRVAPSATGAWNRAIASAGQPAADPGAAAFRRRSKAIVRGSRGW